MSPTSNNLRPVPYIEDNLRYYLDLCGDWAFALDKGLYIQTCYKNADLDDDGAHPSDLVGTSFGEFLPEHCRERIEKLLLSFDGHTYAKLKTSYTDENGDEIDLRSFTVWEQGVFVGYKVILHNRTGEQLGEEWSTAHFRDALADERSRSIAEQAAAKHKEHQRQELLTAVSHNLANSDDIDRDINDILKMVGIYMDADRVTVGRLDRLNSTTSVAYEWHTDNVESVMEARCNIPFNGESREYEALRSNPFIAVSDAVRLDPELQKNYSFMDQKAFIFFPIYAGGELWGNLGVDYCREPHAWSSGEINMLQTIVNAITTSFQKQTLENRLMESDLLLKRVLNHYPGVIWASDINYKCFLFAGSSLEEMGFTRDMFVGKSMIHQFNPHVPAEITQLMARTFEKGAQQMYIEQNGRGLSVHTELMHNRKGEITGLVGVNMDVTQSQRMQAELQRAIDEAEKANMAKSEFLSRMSHEIRTPMNAIIGMTTIARKTDDVAKIQYCLEKIQTASDQLLGLINDVLDIAKIEANKLELSENEFDFERMLQNVCNVIDIKIAEKKQNFIIDFNDVFQRNIIADELRLSQVMINLLTNAVKFTPEGGTVVLKIRQTPVDEALSSFYVEVSDSGIGISKEQQRRLFASFEQADGSITRRYGGTGLGLSICKSIVNIMGGEIALESATGKGSKFYFTVNLKWGNEKGIQDLVRKLPAQDIKILVIDDSEDVREYFVNILESYSLSCQTASSGTQGLQMVVEAISQEEPFDLVFVDWMMPDLNGLDTAKMILRIVHDETIVIMISVADWSDIESQANEIGVTKFLAKPVLPSVLFNSIINWMNLSVVDEESLPPQEPAEQDWKSRNMLLVEDIDINREIIISMLHETGIKIDCAENGREAVDIYLANPKLYDVILMDVQMPEMDGYEATRRIRESGTASAQTVPIVAMTANAFKRDVELCLEAGMNDHIAKPVSMENLIQKIGDALQDQEERERLWKQEAEGATKA